MSPTRSTTPAQATRQPNDDERLGMAWYNGLSVKERRAAIEAADRVRGWDGRDLSQASAPADAWALWKTGRINMGGQSRQ